LADPAPAVVLGRMDRGCVDATWRWLQQPRLRRQVDSARPPTSAGNRRYWQARARQRDRRDFAIRAPDGRHVGNCGLLAVDGGRGDAELWIYLGAARGRGTGGAAMRALLREAFAGLGLRRVYLRVAADNPRAQRFYRSLGFAPWRPPRRVLARYRGRRTGRWYALCAPGGHR